VSAAGGGAQMGRRRFLQKIESTAIAAMLGCRSALPVLLTACGGARYAAGFRNGPDLVVTIKDLGPSGALVEPGEGELPIFVSRLADGQLSAVSTRCMHKGCQVEPSSDRFVCPCHGSEYTFEGRVLKGPTELPLVRYRVSSDDTRVYIHLDSPVESKAGA